jgi:mono/diheme cytochrome c family protein
MAEGGPRPIDFRSADWQRSRSDAELTAAILEGRGAMPPFKDVLRGDEAAALAAYIRRLGTSTHTP